MLLILKCQPSSLTCVVAWRACALQNLTSWYDISTDEVMGQVMICSKDIRVYNVIGSWTCTPTDLICGPNSLMASVEIAECSIIYLLSCLCFDSCRESQTWHGQYIVFWAPDKFEQTNGSSFCVRVLLPAELDQKDSKSLLDIKAAFAQAMPDEQKRALLQQTYGAETIRSYFDDAMELEADPIKGFKNCLSKAYQDILCVSACSSSIHLIYYIEVPQTSLAACHLRLTLTSAHSKRLFRIEQKQKKLGMW